MKKKDVSMFFERQQYSLESHYTDLIELITNMKNDVLSKILANREKTVFLYQTVEKQTKENLTNFINIKADFDMNTEKIVNHIHIDDFSRIMNNYKHRLSKMTDFFYHIAHESLNLIKFDPPPFSPDSHHLSSFITQSFNIANFTTTLIKKRVSQRPPPQSVINKQLPCLSTPTSSHIDNLNNKDSSNTRPDNDVLQKTQKHTHSAMFTNNSTLPANDNVCHSPVKNKNLNYPPLDFNKKDMYVSFGNNKEESSLHKAIQQVKNNHIDP